MKLTCVAGARFVLLFFLSLCRYSKQIELSITKQKIVLIVCFNANLAESTSLLVRSDFFAKDAKHV